MAEAETGNKERKTRRSVPTRQQANPVVRYLRETRGELRKVTWPTWDETWRLTLIVLAVSIAAAVFLGLILDSTFSFMVQGLLDVILGV